MSRSNKLFEGRAEIFGTELAVGPEYTFVGQKAAIFTWHGCTFQYLSANVSEYVSDETPMPIYANLHFALEKLRQEGKPPNVLIVGPRDSGKTVLAKILTSYANKQQRFPMLVNLDPREGVFSVPGGLSAAPISDLLDVEEGWGESPINGPALLHPKQPVVHFYGLESTSSNTKYYKKIISRLALGVQARMLKDPKVGQSGCIIDTSGVSEKDQSNSIIAGIVSDFSVNVIVVVGQEKLYSAMSKQFEAKHNISIIRVPKSGGCVDRETEYIRAVQANCIRQYFYGTDKQTLSPYTVTVDFSLVKVFRVAEENALNISSVLPIGHEDETQTGGANSFLIELEPSSILQNCVMAVLNASPSDPIDILIQAEVLGFVHVVESDDTKRKLKILMAAPGRLPNRPFVIGDFRYHE